MSKRKLSEKAFIDRAYITGLESGRWNVSLNALFFISEAVGLDPVDFVSLVKQEREALEKNSE
ncbi:MAG: helix-turn-helix transcriptional regulator [Desulfovibrio sp.]|nr:helix-turn-helix transcriptional regulator [Desulfovibrio sp.]